MSADRLEHSEQWRVRTFELDSNGHVNNAVYLNYAEQVAVDHAEALGYGREWAERHQVAWAVREHQVVYHRPAVYRDLLLLTTRVQSMGGVRAVRHTTIRREPDGELLAEITTQWVCLKLPEQRPTRIPADLMAGYARDLKPDAAGA
ncbi:MAG TPA: acyl-CoA thioesterase [Candidatus Limnocylindria bacterium]